MGHFPESVRTKALIACKRHCVLCEKHTGIAIECHHIKQAALGGDDSFDNCIPLCPNCHTEVGQYNPKHPKGTKYSENELKQIRDNFYKKINSQNNIFSNSFIKQDFYRVIDSLKTCANYMYDNRNHKVFSYQEGDNAIYEGYVKMFNLTAELDSLKYKIQISPNSEIYSLIKKLKDYIPSGYVNNIFGNHLLVVPEILGSFASDNQYRNYLLYCDKLINEITALT